MREKKTVQLEHLNELLKHAQNKVQQKNDELNKQIKKAQEAIWCMEAKRMVYIHAQENTLEIENLIAQRYEELNKMTDELKANSRREYIQAIKQTIEEIKAMSS